MLGASEPYKIAEKQSYNVESAKSDFYRNMPSTTYGIRDKFKIEYQKI